MPALAALALSGCIGGFLLGLGGFPADPARRAAEQARCERLRANDMQVAAWDHLSAPSDEPDAQSFDRAHWRTVESADAVSGRLVVTARSLTMVADGGMGGLRIPLEHVDRVEVEPDAMRSPRALVVVLQCQPSRYRITFAADGMPPVLDRHALLRAKASIDERLARAPLPASARR
jgi:hypothetical protein